MLKTSGVAYYQAGLLKTLFLKRFVWLPYRTISVTRFGGRHERELKRSGYMTRRVRAVHDTKRA